MVTHLGPTCDEYSDDSRGQGMWVVVDIQGDTLKNAVILGSQQFVRDEGQFIFSDVKAGLGMTRTVVLEWVQCDFMLYPFAIPDPGYYTYGYRRRVRQAFQYRPNSWAKGGWSYSWYPPVTEQWKLD